MLRECMGKWIRTSGATFKKSSKVVVGRILFACCITLRNFTSERYVVARPLNPV